MNVVVVDVFGWPALGVKVRASSSLVTVAAAPESVYTPPAPPERPFPESAPPAPPFDRLIVSVSVALEAGSAIVTPANGVTAASEVVVWPDTVPERGGAPDSRYGVPFAFRSFASVAASLVS